jgi:hypothetical protein
MYIRYYWKELSKSLPSNNTREYAYTDTGESNLLRRPSRWTQVVVLCIKFQNELFRASEFDVMGFRGEDCMMFHENATTFWKREK